MTLYLIWISFGRSSNEIQLCENVESNILTHGAKYLKMVHDVFAKFHTAAINTHNNKVKILWFNYLLLLHYFYITVCCQLHTLHGDSATIQDICGLGRAAGGAAESCWEVNLQNSVSCATPDIAKCTGPRVWQPEPTGTFLTARQEGNNTMEAESTALQYLTVVSKGSQALNPLIVEMMGKCGQKVH